MWPSHFFLEVPIDLVTLTSQEQAREGKMSMLDDGDHTIATHHIPDCLVIEILHRLPPKLVFKFKCVCKEWKTLISEPSFMQSYLSVSSRWTLLSHFDHFCSRHAWGYDLAGEYATDHYVTPQSNFPSGFPFPPDFPGENLCIASSGDLLLCSGPPNGYNVLNPFTKQWIAIPRRPGRYGSEDKGFISRVVNGVAQYKIVVIEKCTYADPHANASYGGENVLHLAIFSSEIGKWRNSMVAVPGKFMLEWNFQKPAIPFNGAIHWVQRASAIIIAYGAYKNTGQCHVIDMSICSENSRLSGLNSVLDECQGRMRYLEVADIIVRPREVKSWSVWVLNDYDRGEWCLQHRGYDREICSLDAWPHVRVRNPTRLLIPIAFHPLDVNLVYFWYEGCILQYNVSTGLFERNRFRIPNAGALHWWVVFPILLPSCSIPIAQPCWETSAGETVMDREVKKVSIRKLLKCSLSCFSKQK
ncbi:hypothetical protein RJ639_031121 [Escallonia herrerae]|uniref:F-box domain-containing protein n=1 Tax=Escallonia herrerae TaxID=1293975 RepID=A0AA88X916_9ASTE|nr:hypothetical protein RJ639_031121 [Escallonia herrerae]